MIRVAVLGAAGRMGRQVCKAIIEDEELSLVAAISPAHAGLSVGTMIGHVEIDVPVSGGLGALETAAAEVAVDFTRPGVVMANIQWLVEHGVHAVVGTTGIGSTEIAEIQRVIAEGGGRSNVVVAPNFAIGAVLLQRFAVLAARFFPAAEVIELHHEGKVDAPSGTALSTARRIAEARTEDWLGPTKESLEGARGGDVEGIRVHSVRLPGLVAHQEVIFGGAGQTLTMRHDSLDRSSFTPGVILAIKAVASRPGLTVGLESLLGLPEASS